MLGVPAATSLAVWWLLHVYCGTGDRAELRLAWLGITLCLVDTFGAGPLRAGSSLVDGDRSGVHTARLPIATRLSDLHGFRWHDGERIIRFGRGALADAPKLLGEGYTLLTTPRAAQATPALAEPAAVVLYVDAGRVDELAAELRPRRAG